MYISISHFRMTWAKDVEKSLAKDAEKTWAKDVEKTWVKDVEKTWAKDAEKTWAKDVEKTWTKDIEKTWIKVVEKTWIKAVEKTWIKDVEKNWAKDTEKTWTKDVEKTRAKNVEKTWTKDVEKTWTKDAEKTWTKDAEKTWTKDVEKSSYHDGQFPGYHQKWVKTQRSGRVAATVTTSKSLAWLNQRKWGFDPYVPSCWGDCLAAGPQKELLDGGQERAKPRCWYHGGRQPSSVDSFHSPTIIPPSALDKPSIMKRYHRRWTTRWGATACSPTMVTLHDTRFVECWWWNDGRTVKTVVTWRSSTSMVPAPSVSCPCAPCWSTARQTTILLLYLHSPARSVGVTYFFVCDHFAITQAVTFWLRGWCTLGVFM